MNDLLQQLAEQAAKMTAAGHDDTARVLHAAAARLARLEKTTTEVRAALVNLGHDLGFSDDELSGPHKGET